MNEVRSVSKILYKNNLQMHHRPYVKPDMLKLVEVNMSNTLQNIGSRKQLLESNSIHSRIKTNSSQMEPQKTERFLYNERNKWR